MKLRTKFGRTEDSFLSKIFDNMGIIVIVCVVLMVIGGLYNYSMYRDCIADGNKPYVCQSLINGSVGARFELKMESK